jgi:hypothetical protein
VSRGHITQAFSAYADVEPTVMIDLGTTGMTDIESVCFQTSA